MDVRYSAFDPLRQALAELIRRLKAIFEHFVLQTGGDVERALRLLDHFGKRYGLFSERFGIAEFRKLLQKEGTIAKLPGGRLRLTPRGEQAIRKSSLEAIFSSLEKDAGGEHRVSASGVGNEILPETRGYEFGDPVALLDAQRSLGNAILGTAAAGAGLDELRIAEDDLEVHETEHVSSCATVLLVDVSHSMILYGEDRITPAKRVALALTELIATRYPKDTLRVVLFGDEAWEVPRRDLPYIQVGPFHTNTRAGLRLAQEILRKARPANRQIFMITDGKPSALTEPGGEIYKNPFGLDRRIVSKTLDEAAACRRLGIPITTFMITDEPQLVDFVERFTRVNCGRAYYAQLDRLGTFVFVDYIRNRRRRQVR